MSSVKSYIGLLGLGSHSTLFYLDQLNFYYNQKKGGYSTCPLKMLNADFNDLNPYLPNQFDKLLKPTKAYLEKLSTMEVDRIIVPNITLHETIDQLNFTAVNLIHPVNETIIYCQKNKVNKVTVFGSSYTMSSNYIPLEFEKYNIKVVSPSSSDMKDIDRLRKAVYNHTATKEDHNHFEFLINRYNKESSVLMACTELSLVLNNIDCEQVVDMVEIQIKSALNL